MNKGEKFLFLNIDYKLNNNKKLKMKMINKIKI